MQSKTPLKKALLILGFEGFVFLLFLFFHTTRSFYVETSIPPQNQISNTVLQQTDPGLPIRLRIPSINVDAAIEYVGLTPEEAMDGPKNFNNVGWFKLGSRPGEKGSAVIAGHRGWKDGVATVFNNLHNLHKGDNLYIEDGKGTSISFIVQESRTYDPEEYVSDVFSQNDGSHLNLITCDGVWDKSQKTYTKRLVIFADAVQ